MLKHNLADKNGIVSDVNSDPGEDPGLVVATREHKTYTTKTAFAINPTYGREMAQNGLYAGTPLLIHDGADAVAWTFSEPVGNKWTENSSDQAHAGSQSLKTENSSLGDIMQLINNVGPGDDIVLTGNYVAVTMWIYVDKDFVTGDSYTLYAHLDGALVGNVVSLEDYFPYLQYDAWHFVNIPLADMGLGTSTIDAFRIENNAKGNGKSPKFYIDEFNLQESGAAIEFEIVPDVGTWFYIKSFQTVFVDAYNADNADSTMPHLSYNKILGMTPTVGYLFQRFTGGGSSPMLEMRITNTMDLLSFPYAKITNQMSDGTNTLMTVSNPYPDGMFSLLKYENCDRIVYSLEDNFSQLLYFRISVQGYVEKR